jgi:hypothetical protein
MQWPWPVKYRPARREGLNIHYKLKDSGETFVSIGKRLHVTKQTVCDVASGRRRSARIEAEIARILGKGDWDEVVIEARSEVQKKPVAAILKEMQQAGKEAAKRPPKIPQSATPEMLARTDWKPRLQQLAEERARGLHGSAGETAAGKRRRA